MRTESFLSLNPQGFHRVEYKEWGAVDNPRVLVCVHGLARNSRDFDELAQALAHDYRVICPDIVGRGQSDWLPTGSPYAMPQYLQDMVALIARLNVKQVDWVGTSMGGLIGMALAAYPNSPIRRLVLNDIGAFISQEALARIAGYVGLDPSFESLDELQAHLRQQYPAFAGLSEQQWQHLARQGSRLGDDQRLRLHYDPVIGEYAQAMAAEDIALWPLWQQVSCPQLLLWGEASDVLSADTVTRMCQLNPNLALTSWAGIGHAPSLMESQQIQTVVDWLRAGKDSDVGGLDN
ncbi:MAG: pimeloyl-ACP methyl ester carboxylesterase [Motiliproteus sp.]|jgi:pimeloyl-ACP methyl ester carboxylesterase